MEFKFTEEHKMIREAARDFAQNELLLGVIERDEQQSFPTNEIKKLGDLGFMGMMVDQNMTVLEWIQYHMFWQWKRFLKLTHLLLL